MFYKIDLFEKSAKFTGKKPARKTLDSELGVFHKFFRDF